MTSATRKSLEYLERTARLLLDDEHPAPRRAAHLLRYHASKVAHAATAEWPEEDN